MKNISLIEVTSCIGTVDDRMIKLNCLLLASMNEGVSNGKEYIAQRYFDWVTSNKSFAELSGWKPDSQGEIKQQTT
jgi:hypothetical protein